MVNQKVSVTGVAASDWIVLDPRNSGSLTIKVIPNGGTISIQSTVGPNMDAITSDDIDDITDMTGLTANGQYSVPDSLLAVRINQTVGATEASMVVLQTNS